MAKIYTRKTNRGYEWDVIKALPPKSGCDGCARLIGYDGRGYAKCRRYYSCLSGDYYVLVPYMNTPCRRFIGKETKKNIKTLGEGGEVLIFSSRYEKRSRRK